MANKKLESINNDIKEIINISSSISNTCRNKIINEFSNIYNIDLKTDNYLNVDLSFKDNNTIIYLSDEYKLDNNLSLEDINNKHSQFMDKSNNIINRYDNTNSNKKLFNNIINLLIILLIFIIFIFLFIYGIKSFLRGDYFHVIWFVIFVSSFISPVLRDNLKARIEQAKNFFKRRNK